MRKLTFLAAFVAMLGLFVAVPTGQAEAYSKSNKRAQIQSRVCNALERTEIQAWKNFDQNNPSSVKRVQNRINIQDKFNCAPNGTIVEQLVERQQFSTLATALTTAGLVDTFNQPGDYTVFAPTNQAFEKLGADTINAVLADLPTLTNILAYHVVDPAQVPTSVPSDVAVTLSSAPMFNGDSVDIEIRNGKLFINDSQVVITDVKANNGIVHVIDTVLLPS